ncbi:MAG: polyprenol monophosphomannose synthase [Candidatus Nomurabacteria bacterium]|nr:MAG: polyprenol monophosphomannose synthase [Candidatus Nomurabacteria bacterium]
MKLGISIPTYNEAKNIDKLLSNIKSTLSNQKNTKTIIVVVDDSSPDNTGKVVEKFAKLHGTNNFRVLLLTRKVKDGFGKACIAGFNKLLDEKVDYILQMDADLSHNPKYIPKFIDSARSGHDFIVASRYISGGGTPDWPLHRRILSKYGNFYARFVLNNKISDYTGGYNLYSRDLLSKIDLNSINSTGYGFLIELKYKALQNCISAKQIPINFRDRQHGKSKIPKNTLIKNLILVPKLKFKRGL